MKRPVFLFAAILPVAALSSTLVPHTIAQRFVAADRVALVQVVERITEPPTDGRTLKTYTRLLVGDDFKGQGPRELTLVQLGGRYGAVDARISGDADFALGETALVFLRCRQPDRCVLVALGEGKVPVVGGDALVHDLVTGRWRKQPLNQLRADLIRDAKALEAAR